MARHTNDYKLWQHDPAAPKKAERIVIAKVRPEATAPRRASASALSASARAVRSAGVSPDSPLTRLLEKAWT